MDAVFGIKCESLVSSDIIKIMIGKSSKFTGSVLQETKNYFHQAILLNKHKFLVTASRNRDERILKHHT